jgi:hypothetical protein
MAEHKSARFEKAQLNAIEQAQQLGLADNQTEAMKLLINAGAAEHGILNGNAKTTVRRSQVRRLMQDVSNAAAYLGLFWGLALSLFPASSVNWVIVGPVMLALLVVVFEDLFFNYG